MHFRPYLNFDGTTAEAMKFYQSVFGGNLDLIKFRDAPGCEQMPAADADRVMHAYLAVGNDALMASDTMPGQPYEGMKNVGVTLAYDTADEARRVFDKLSAGGKVTMPVDKTFWAEAFGMLTDRFGTCWLVNGGLIPRR